MSGVDPELCPVPMTGWSLWGRSAPAVFQRISANHESGRRTNLTGLVLITLCHVKVSGDKSSFQFLSAIRSKCSSTPSPGPRGVYPSITKGIRR